MMTPDEVRSRILEAFPDAQIELEDLTGTQDHYSLSVVSAAFRGKGLLAQQRMVYAALGDAMKGPIHALALQTKAPPAEG